MDIALLLPFILLIGVMLLMTRSAKNRQRQALEMRSSMDPGTGVRTIGGMYALVKEVRDDTVLLELAPGTHVLFAKNAIGAVLEAEEYERIISGESPFEDEESPAVPDDASSLTEGEEDTAEGGRVGLGKAEPAKPKSDGEEAASPEDGDDDGGNGPKS